MKGFYREGWVCPVCKAVMSPYCDSCKNCTGRISIYIPQAIDTNIAPEIIANNFQTTISLKGDKE